MGRYFKINPALGREKRERRYGMVIHVVKQSVDRIETSERAGKNRGFCASPAPPQAGKKGKRCYGMVIEKQSLYRRENTKI